MTRIRIFVIVATVVLGATLFPPPAGANYGYAASGPIGVNCAAATLNWPNNNGWSGAMTDQGAPPTGGFCFAVSVKLGCYWDPYYGGPGVYDTAWVTVLRYQGTYAEAGCVGNIIGSTHRLINNGMCEQWYLDGIFNQPLQYQGHCP